VYYFHSAGVGFARNDAQWAELQAGKYYVNVHTAKFPDGGIRGQLEAAK